MVPEVLLRLFAHPSFQHGGIGGYDALHVCLTIIRFHHRNRFAHEPEPAIGPSEHSDEIDGASEPERKYGSPTRSLCKLAEEQHETGFQSANALITQK